MKKLLIVFLLLGLVITGCSKEDKNVEAGPDNTVSDIVDGTDKQDTDIIGREAAEASGFDYSGMFDDKGYIKELTALSYVTDLFNYTKFAIPKDVSTVTDEAVQEQIQAICNYYGLHVEITEGVIKEGDRVNIDYVGMVDGVEFDGGSTENQGTIVTAGSEEYIDDFLTQIIGHKPGDTLDIIVTFPEDYGVAELDGKEAKFKTTINYIVGEGKLTDEDVETYLSFSNGWVTVKEAEDGIRENLQQSQIRHYISEYITDFAKNTLSLDQLPSEYIEYYADVTIAYHQDAAHRANMSFPDYLVTFLQVENEETLLDLVKEENETALINSIVIQAIAEAANIQVSDEDMDEYMNESANGIDIESLPELEQQFGIPYIKHIVLQYKILNLLYDNSVL